MVIVYHLERKKAPS